MTNTLRWYFSPKARWFREQLDNETMRIVAHAKSDKYVIDVYELKAEQGKYMWDVTPIGASMSACEWVSEQPLSTVNEAIADAEYYLEHEEEVRGY